MATYTFTVHAGVGAVTDAAVTVNGVRFDVDAALAAGSGGGAAGTSFKVTDNEDLVSALRGMRAGAGPLLDVDGVPDPDPAPVPAQYPVYAAIGAPVGGQTLVFDATLGLWLPGVPAVSGKEIAYAENVSAVTQTLVGVANTLQVLDIANCAITVPANTGPVWLEASFYGQQTAGGVGLASAAIIETTAGASPTGVGIESRPLPNATGNNSARMTLRAKRRLGAIASARTFKLQLALAAPAGSNPSFQVFNGFAGYNEYESYILAEVK